MDALDLLEQQHRHLAELFTGLISTEGDPQVPPGRLTGLAAQLVRAVEAHSRVEEAVFYAAFTAQIPGATPRLYDAYEAHALLRFAAENLLRTRATDVRFRARVKLVHDLFERHAALEEDWMFPKAKRALHDEALDRIGDDLERAHCARLAVARAVPDRLRVRRRASHPAAAERPALS